MWLSIRDADSGTSFIFGCVQDVEYLIRAVFQREASLKLGVQELFLVRYRGAVMLNWERRNKTASAKAIQQHTLITP